MKKIILDLEDLVVDSFAVLPEDETAGGTVAAHYGTRWNEDTCYGPSCRLCPTDRTDGCSCDGTCDTCYGTCPATCPNTCAATCPYTCDDASCGGGCGSDWDTCGGHTCDGGSACWNTCTCPL